MPSPPPVTAVRSVEPVARHDDVVNQDLSQAVPVKDQARPSGSVNPNISKGKAPATKESGAAHTQPSKPLAGTAVSKSLPSSATRPISPPPKAVAAKTIINPDTPVPVVPRKLTKEPATFTKRVALLKALHTYLKPHNDKLLKAVKPEIKALHLDTNQLNKLAVDEEERIAISNPSVYENILKQRLVKLKGMTPEDWVKERRAAVAAEKGEPPKKPPPKRVDTGLSSEDEITFLRTLKCEQKGLDQYGYVTHLPSDAELNETRLALDTPAGWEESDRCKTRFQVFPDQNE